MNIETGDYARLDAEEAMRRLTEDAAKEEDIVRVEATEEQMARLSEQVKAAKLALPKPRGSRGRRR